MLIRLGALSFILAAGTWVAPAAMAASAPPASGIPCSGVWKMNEQQSHRARSSTGPILELFAPWGKNGWIRINAADENAQFYQLPEWQFAQFNDKTYHVFGGTPSLQKVHKFTGNIFVANRVMQDGQSSDPVFWVFSKDCKHITYLVPQGEDRRAPPGQNIYYNELRVFDRIEPPAGAATPAVATEIFGGWELNRTASKLTLPPGEAATLVIIPWGTSGWVWKQMAGGPYQPEDMHKGTGNLNCGAASSPTPVPCKGAPSSLVLYWASWDSKSFPTYGLRRGGQVQVKQVNDRTFEATLSKNAQAAAQADKTTVALAADGRRLTVTTKSAASADDVRVYDRIDADNWPTGN